MIFLEERLNAVKEMNSEVECLRGKVPQKLHIAIGHVAFELPKSNSHLAEADLKVSERAKFGSISEAAVA